MNIFGPPPVRFSPDVRKVGSALANRAIGSQMMFNNGKMLVLTVSDGEAIW